MQLSPAAMEPLLPSARRPVASIRAIVGVSCSIILFGAVAVLIKLTSLPTLLMLQCRSAVELVITFAIATMLPRGGSATEGGSSSISTHLDTQLLGPPPLRTWLILRALVHWGFLATWWLSLANMPLGDATAILYCGPVFTAIFARIVLRQKLKPSFAPLICLDTLGLILILQPFPLFDLGGKNTQGRPPNYYRSAGCAFISAMLGGLLPLITQRARHAPWTASTFVAAATTTFVVNPVAWVGWKAFDGGANTELVRGLAELVSGSTKGLTLLLAILLGFGARCCTLLYPRAEVAKAAALTNLEIPLAYVLQYVCFGERIGLLALVGVAILVSATAANLCVHWLTPNQRVSRLSAARASTTEGAATRVFT